MDGQKKTLAILKVKWLPQRDGHYSRNLSTIYSGTLPNDHLINIITLLLRSLFCAEKMPIYIWKDNLIMPKRFPQIHAKYKNLEKHAIK